MNTPWFGGSGGAYPTPYYGNWGQGPSAYNPSAEASSLPDGGTVVGGALLLLLGAAVYQQAKEDGFSFRKLLHPEPEFKAPTAKKYSPSYYGVTSQKNRVAYVTDVKNAKAGQQYSNALIDLGNDMRRTPSLQAALSHQATQGYEDFIVGEGKNPETHWGKHFGVQSTQQFGGFRKEDNNNPYKPRYVLCIGNSSKQDQFDRTCKTMQEEYNVPSSHMLRCKATTPKAIEAAFKELQQRTGNQPHAEIVIVTMPDHSNRKDPKLGEGPEGTQEVTFFDENTQDQKITETKYKALLNQYLGEKKTLTIFTACRAGSIVA